VLAGSTNSYSGPTNVNAGTLLVNGTMTGGGAVTVAAGAVLGGAARSNGSVQVNALAPSSRAIAPAI